MRNVYGRTPALRCHLSLFGISVPSIDTKPGRSALVAIAGEIFNSCDLMPIVVVYGMPRWARRPLSGKRQPATEGD